MDFVVYAFYRIAVALVALLPLRLVFSLGWLLGAGAHLVAVKYRKLAVRNLTIAFGNEKSPREIRAIARRHFATLGANLLSSFKMASMSGKRILRLVTVEGRETILAALARGQGCI